MRQKRVLIISTEPADKSPAGAAEERLAHPLRECGLVVEFTSAKVGQIMQRLDRADAMILSGSVHSINEKGAWIDDYLRAIQDWMDARRHTLGVCFGMQAMAVANGGSVGRLDEPQFGVRLVKVNRESQAHPLWANLPNQLPVASTHFDTVKVLPDNAHTVASSSNVANQVISFTHPDATEVIQAGTQFHPEATPQSLMAMIDQFRDQIPHPDVTLAGLSGQFQAPGTTLLCNFAGAVLRS